jgi:CRISPR system Cascade subunit CasB
VTDDTPQDIGAVAKRWWRRTIRPDHESGRARAVRAMLRRAESPLDVVVVPEVHDLNHALAAAGRDLTRDADRLALVAVVLANLESDTPDRAAARMGGAHASRAPVSALRFQRLVRTRRPGELMRPLTRALAQIDHAANVRALSRDLLTWGERTRRNWCFDYYGAARPTEAQEKEAVS